MDREEQDILVKKTIGGELRPPMLKGLIKKENKLQAEIMNLENDMEYLDRYDFAEGYYEDEPIFNVRGDSDIKARIEKRKR